MKKNPAATNPTKPKPLDSCKKGKEYK